MQCLALNYVYISMTRSLGCCLFGWVFLPRAFFFLLLVFKLLNQSIQHIMLRHVLLHNVIKNGSDFARQNKVSLEPTALEWKCKD